MANSTQSQVAQIQVGDIPVAVIPVIPKRSWSISNIGSVPVNIFPYSGNLPNAAPAAGVIPLQPGATDGDSDQTEMLVDGWAAIVIGTATSLVVGVWR